MNVSPSGNFVGGIKAQAAQLGNNANIQYKYSVGEDGKLFVESAKITGTVEKPTITAPTPTPVRNNSDRDGNFPNNDLGLSPSDLAEIFGLNSNENIVTSRLQAADAGVRTHEAQHFRAAGGLVQGTAEYEYVEGPDGKLYAVAGEVEINPTNGADAEQQAQDATTLYNAATAPGDASAQDLSVARAAINNANAAYKTAIQTSADI